MYKYDQTHFPIGFFCFVFGKNIKSFRILDIDINSEAFQFEIYKSVFVLHSCSYCHHFCPCCFCFVHVRISRVQHCTYWTEFATEPADIHVIRLIDVKRLSCTLFWCYSLRIFGPTSCQLRVKLKEMFCGRSYCLY